MRTKKKKKAAVKGKTKCGVFMGEERVRIKFASDCGECPGCGEAWCREHREHYTEEEEVSDTGGRCFRVHKYLTTPAGATPNARQTLMRVDRHKSPPFSILLKAPFDTFAFIANSGSVIFLAIRI